MYVQNVLQLLYYSIIYVCTCEIAIISNIINMHACYIQIIHCTHMNKFQLLYNIN